MKLSTGFGSLADGDDLAFDLLKIKGASGIVSNQWRNQSTGGALDLCIFTVPCVSADQFCSQEPSSSMVSGAKIYAVFRYSNSANPFYLIVLDFGADTVTWKRVNLAGTIDDTIDSGALVMAFGDTLTVTIGGIGDATTVRVWNEGPGSYNTETVYSPSSVKGGSSPGLTLTANPASPVDEGVYCGFGGSGTAAGDCRSPFVGAGDCAIKKIETHYASMGHYGAIAHPWYADGIMTNVIAGGVNTITYPDAATTEQYAGCGMFGDTDLGGSAVYWRWETNIPRDGNGPMRVIIKATESDINQWFMEFTVDGCLIGSKHDGASTTRQNDTGITQANYRWIRVRVSADLATIYFDRAADAADGNGPGTWTAIGNWATSLTPNWTPEKCYFTWGAYRVTDTAGDVYGIMDAINTGRTTWEQEGYRLRNDDGDEDAATWAAAQDTQGRANALQNVRVRGILNTVGDAPSVSPTLEYRKVGVMGWRQVPL